MNELFKPYSTLKSSGIIHGTDLVKLGILTDPLAKVKGIYCVHLERIMPNESCEYILYQGDDLQKANGYYNTHSTNRNI